MGSKGTKTIEFHQQLLSKRITIINEKNKKRSQFHKKYKDLV